MSSNMEELREIHGHDKEVKLFKYPNFDLRHKKFIGYSIVPSAMLTVKTSSFPLREIENKSLRFRRFKSLRFPYYCLISNSLPEPLKPRQVL
mmetsp:Transcript_25492/g.84298  ORF Transcript_25492/g.84298 Transcript_25492/m.84298 type:complete len:92 (-) Transcript_25492:113-388(-)